MSAKEILEGLRAEKSKTSYKNEKYAYYKTKEYVQRMDDVIGRENYTATYDSLQITPLPSGQMLVTCHCHIDIYEGNKIILSADGYGSKEIEHSNSTGGFISLNNIAYFCQQSAFISACKELNIFSSATSDNSNSNNVTGRQNTVQNVGARSADRTSASTSTTKNNADVEIMFQFNGVVEVESERTKNGKTEIAYRAMCNRVFDGKLDDTPCMVLFFENQYSKCAEKFARLRDMLGPHNPKGVKCIMLVKETSKSTAEFPHYTFKDFAKRN